MEINPQTVQNLAFIISNFLSNDRNKTEEEFLMYQEACRFLRNKLREENWLLEEGFRKLSEDEYDRSGDSEPSGSCAE